MRNPEIISNYLLILCFMGVFVINGLPQEHAWMLESKEEVQRNVLINKIKGNSIKNMEKKDTIISTGDKIGFDN